MAAGPGNVLLSGLLAAAAIGVENAVPIAAPIVVPTLAAVAVPIAVVGIPVAAAYCITQIAKKNKALKIVREELRKTREEMIRRAEKQAAELHAAQDQLREAEAEKALFAEHWLGGIPPGVEYIPEEVIRLARESFLDGKRHIAFVGHTGAGKSSLVNSIRGLKAGEQGAARVGQTECTRTTTGYADLRYPEYVWYDVPGAGTVDCPDWQYFIDQELCKYDALVVVFSDRITQNDTRVLADAAKVGIPTFLARSKSERIMRDMQEDSDEDVVQIKTRYVQETRDYVRRLLGQVEGINGEKRVYLVSRNGVRRAVAGEPPTQRDVDDRELLNDLLQIQPVR